MKCGSVAGYARHVRLGQPRCRPCKDAHAAYTRERRRRIARKEPLPPRDGIGEAIVDQVVTDGPVTVRELHGLLEQRRTVTYQTVRRTVYRLLDTGRLTRTDTTPFTIAVPDND